MPKNSHIRRTLAALLLFCCSLSAFADGYKDLWNRVEEAENNDLPKTALQLLEQIISLSEKDGSYGNLFKAELKRITMLTAITPDSLAPAVERLVEKEKRLAKTNSAADAVYCSVLANVYENNHALSDDWAATAREYYDRSLQNPELLAQHKLTEFSPLLNARNGDKMFDDDLLHVLAREADRFDDFSDYYDKSGNRVAALLTGHDKILSLRNDKVKKGEPDPYINAADSLIQRYGDLDWAGEVEYDKFRYLVNNGLMTEQEQYDYLQKAAVRWKNWAEVNRFKNDFNALINPQYNVDFGNRMMRTNEKRMVKINQLRNIKDIVLTITKVDIDGSNAEYNVDSEDGFKQIKQKLASKPVYHQQHSHASSPEWKVSADSFLVENLPYGTYLMEVASTDKSVLPSRKLLNVSDLYVMCEAWPEKSYRYTVVDATTGKPVPHANVRLRSRYSSNDKVSYQNLTTDNNGEAVFTNTSGNTYQMVWVSTKDDRSFLDTELLSHYSNYIDKSVYTDVHLYTDRAIYRPGQTVHVGLILNKRHPDNATPVIADKKVTLVLRDANYKEVDKREVVTDEFGTASCDFTLPENGLTGRFQVQASGYRSTSFNVEEYKRPTFMVEIGEVEGKYQLGDTVTVKGTAKSYAGVPVQNATVKYEIERRSATWWRYYVDEMAQKKLLTDTVKTDDKGEFIVRVPLADPDADNDNTQTKRYPRYYSFSINAEVTDQGGETHQGYGVVSVGTRPTVMWCDLPDKVEKDSLRTIRFSYKNAAGNDIPGTVTYWFDDSPKAYTAEANAQVNIAETVKALKTGKHTLHAICGNDTIENKTILFSLHDTKPCYQTHDWFYVQQTTFPTDGRPVKIQVGSSDDDTYIYYAAIAKDEVIEHGVQRISNAVLTKSYTYKDIYGDGVYLSFAWVKNDTLYSHSVVLQKPLPSKRLNVKWTTFRDRLEPGQQETWTAQITTPEGKPADAQLMAVLYDKSLDQIKRHSWSFRLPLRQQLPSSYWTHIRYYNQYDSWNKHRDYLNVPTLKYAGFDSSLFNFYSRRIERLRSAVNGSYMVLDSAPMMVEEAALDRLTMGAAKAKTQAGAVAEEADGEAEAQEEPAGSSDADVRENLNETAFFMPALHTDDKGNVTLNFTLPESLTTWRFIGLAHDRNANYGMLAGEAIAQKKVMIQPNMPRFMRAQDKANITARLFNTTDETKQGTATLQLLDPETRAVLHSQDIPYTIAPNATTPVTFALQPDGTASMYVCRLIAKGADYSDGEQQYLAVLPEKELVTNTLPFTLHKAGTKTIDLKSMFAVSDPTNKLTLEYTNNPAWLMIQTLPTYSSPYEDNVIDQAVSYYVNTLGKHILNSAPHISTVVNTWREEKGEETSLSSALEKNQELKNLVLNETPWLLEADKEASQKRSLMKFFDEPTMRLRLQTALTKMKELQLSDGSWTWWKGMKGSIYMTVSVCTMLERINLLTESKDENTTAMLEKAYPFIDSYLKDEYEEMRKAEKKGMKAWRPSSTVIDILYLNAVTGRSLNAITQKATKYMLNLLEKRTTEFTIYGKAKTAIILARNNRVKKAEAYLQSMDEYSVMTEEMGRYYDTPKAYYSWQSYKIPTQVAVIEAFKMLHPDREQIIEELQRWLLQQKRTQSWSTPINSVNAVYAFLKGNMTVLDRKDDTSFLLNGQTVDVSSQTAGLGYVKIVETGTDMNTLSIEKPSDGTSWGAVYAQFFQKSTDVDATDGQLKIRRELITPDGNALKVGDKVTIRITIEAQRDYDFVQVVDKRAACMEPIQQLSGYRYGYYTAPKDNATHYYFNKLAKGTYIIESQYYIDRAGTYQTGTCTAQCAYAPEYSARDKAIILTVSEQ